MEGTAVSVFRRRRLPDELVGPHESFVHVLAQIEPAKEALTEVMPTTRLPGRPLPDALTEFERRLDAAREAMPGWRRGETEAVWTACDAGITEALARARRMREDAPDIGGFEGLIWAVERLLDPLEPFRGAAEHFHSLRVSGA